MTTGRMKGGKCECAPSYTEFEIIELNMLTRNVSIFAGAISSLTEFDNGTVNKNGSIVLSVMMARG